MKRRSRARVAWERANRLMDGAGMPKPSRMRLVGRDPGLRWAMANDPGVLGVFRTPLTFRGCEFAASAALDGLDVSELP